MWLLGPGREHWEALQGMGLRHLGDLLGVPRSGLARRFSENLLLELDTAFGARPDPREPIVLPPSFESRLELFARADTTEQVLHGASVLLERLIAWLSAQHAFVRRFKVLMRHEARWLSSQRESDAAAQATALEIALAEPSRDSSHLLVLLRERLARLQLPAPTLELWLQAEDITKKAPPTAELFPTHKSEHEGLTRLIERLQARLGVGQVQRLVAMEDHRPESASALTPADASVGALMPAGAAANAATHAHVSAHAHAHVSHWQRRGPECGHGSAPCLDPGARALGRTRHAAALRRPAPAVALGAGAHRGRLVGRVAGRARLLHRRDRRGCAGLDLSGSVAVGARRRRGWRRPDVGLVSPGSLRLRRRRSSAALHPPA